MAKVTNLRQATASKSSTDGGSVTFSDKAAITDPSEFRITIPRPAQFNLLKITPSQLALSWSGESGSQCEGWLPIVIMGDEVEAAWNSLSLSNASLQIWDKGNDELPTLAALQFAQILHAI